MDPVTIAALTTLVGSIIGPLVGHYLEIRRSAVQESSARPQAASRVVAGDSPRIAIDVDALEPKPAPGRVVVRPQLASFVVRGIAFWIDLMIVLAAGSLVAGGVFFAEESVGVVLGVLFYPLWVTYCIAGWTRWGTTIGKKIFGLYVVSADGQVGLSSGRAFLRFIGYILGFLTGWIGFLVALGNPRRRALHDFLASSYVVRLKSP